MPTEEELRSPRWLTVNETAAVLLVHPRTVWRYLASGRLTAVRHPTNRKLYLWEPDVSEALRAAQEKYHALRPETYRK